MARIAANVAAFVLIATSIGLNMWRYPAVWEMIGGAPYLSQADQSEQPVLTVQHEPVETISAPMMAIAAEPPTDEPSEAFASADDSRPYAEPQSPAEEIKPAEVALSPAYASAVEPPDADCESTPADQLVPVVCQAERQDSLEPPGFERQVLRLPPADQYAPSAAEGFGEPAAEGVVGPYPSTGIE